MDACSPASGAGCCGEPGGRCHHTAWGWLLQPGSAGMCVAAPWGVSWPHFRAYSQSVGCLGLTEWTGRQARGALGLSPSSRFFTSWLLTGQQHSKKESGGCNVLEAKVKPHHFCGCLLVQTRYPQVPDLGEVGRHFVVIFNLSGKATTSRPKGLGRNQVTGAPHTWQRSFAGGRGKGWPWWRPWEVAMAMPWPLPRGVISSSPLSPLQLWGLKLGFRCPRRITYLNKLHQTLVFIFPLLPLKTLHLQTVKLFLRKILYEEKTGKCLLGMCT